MPRRSRIGRAAVTYGDGHRWHLLTGHDYLGDAFGEGQRFRRADAARAWAELRRELLLEHIADHPCTRPWAWWEFEDHPRRRTVRMRPEDYPREPARPWPWDRPCSWWQAMLDGKWYEAEAVYLARHGLLTKREAEYLAAHPELRRPVSALDIRGKTG